MEVSLFPFLSILACLIGSLTLIITVLSLSQLLTGRDDERVAIAEDYVSIQRQIAEQRDKAEALKKQLAQRDSLRAQWISQQQIVRDLRDRFSSIPDPFADKAATERRIADAKQQLADTRKAADELAAKIKATDAERAQLEKLAKGSVPLRILPSGDFHRRLRPVFIEARKDGVVIHSPSRKITVPWRDIPKNADFEKVARFVADDPNRSIVFLIRSDARGPYRAAEERARQLGAVTSKVPLVGDGELDLTHFFNN
jgi:hypothetical protein